MLFKNIYIPLEIQIYILSKIKDTKGYKNARLVCKDWYHELKVLKLFDNRNLTKYITFSPKEILVVILVFVYWWPIIPHMSLYNNWNNVLMMLPLGYLLRILYARNK